MVVVDNNDGVVVVDEDEDVDEEFPDDQLILDVDVDHVDVVYVNLLDPRSNWVLVMMNYVFDYAVLLVDNTT